MWMEWTMGESVTWEMVVRDGPSDEMGRGGQCGWSGEEKQSKGEQSKSKSKAMQTEPYCTEYGIVLVLNCRSLG
jgi:hypothetical protein